MGFYERGGKIHFTCGWGPGFIYMMRGGADRYGRYKLGMSVDPHGRARSMGLTLLHTIGVPNMRRAEKSAQWMFAHRRTVRFGERFHLTPRDVATFKSLTWKELDTYFAEQWKVGREGTNCGPYLLDERHHEAAIPRAVERIGRSETLKDLYSALKAMGGEVRGFLATADDYARVKQAFEAAIYRIQTPALCGEGGGK